MQRSNREHVAVSPELLGASETPQAGTVEVRQHMYMFAASVPALAIDMLQDHICILHKRCTP